MFYGLFPLFYVCVIKRLSSQYTSLFDIERKHKSILLVSEHDRIIMNFNDNAFDFRLPMKCAKS